MLERQRAGTHGARDLSIDVWRSRGRELNLRAPLPGLEPNPDDGGRRRWPLLDSLGRTLALLEQDADAFVTSHADTGREIHRDSAGLSLQGRGAMAEPGLERSHALVAVDASDHAGLPPGGSIVPFRIRGFVDRAALHRDVAVDRARTGRGRCNFTPLSRGPLEDPGFRNSERFVGEDGIARTYATYNAKRPFAGALYLCVNTTGVHGGGIVRAVARAGDEVQVLDELAEPDSNAEAGTPIARWRFLRLVGTAICGWAPVRV